MPLSDDFWKHIYPAKGVRRKTKARILYSLTAPETKDGGTLEMPPGNSFSRVDQVLNGTYMTAKIFTNEPDNVILDGTYVLPLPPEDSKADNMEMGWWSEVRSDENGVFATPQTCRRVFPSIKRFTSLGIMFDQPTNNFCTDFEAYFYDPSGALVHYEHITDNNSAYGRTREAGFNILTVIFVAHKTNKPIRHARINEFDYGVFLEFPDAEIKSISSVDQVDRMGRSFISPDMQISIFNLDRFNLLNEKSYAPFILAGQKITTEFFLVFPDGTEELALSNNRILMTSTVKDDIVTLNTRGVTELLPQSLFFDSSFEMLTIGQMIQRNFSGTVVPFQIADSILNSVKFPAFFGNVSYRRMLDILTNLSSCFVFEDEDNVVQFRDILTESFGEFAWNYKLDGTWALGEKPFATIGREADGDVLNTGIMYRSTHGSPSPKIEDYFNGINLSEYEMSVEERQLAKVNFTVSGSMEVNISFNSPVQGVPTYTLDNGFTLTNVRFYTMYMVGTLQGNGTAEIVVTGSAVSLNKTQMFYPAPWNSGKEPEQPYAIDLPMMIRIQGYELFRDWFLERKFKMMAMRLNIAVKWRQNPGYRLGWSVDTQIDKRGGSKIALLTMQEYQYGGGGALGGFSELVTEVGF